MDFSPASFRLDVRELDDLCPLFSFARNKFPELGRRTRQRRAAEVGEPRSELAIGQARIDFLVESLDNIWRRIPAPIP